MNRLRAARATDPGGCTMAQDYDVDTDVLRTMASSARDAVAGLSDVALSVPTDSGHEWIDGAAADVAAAWDAGLGARVTDTDDFADRLENTARVFDKGTDAARAEIDAMLWED